MGLTTVLRGSSHGLEADMPFRLDEYRAKIQFTTAHWMPHRIYEACKRTGMVSNTVYCQYAICEALSRDLGIPLEDLINDLPAPRGPSAHLYDPAEGTMNRFESVAKGNLGGRVMIGPANTIEEVR